MMRTGQPTSTLSADGFSSLAGRTVLQIIPELDAGGAERTAIDVAAALVNAGARALVASEGGRLVSELQARGGLWIPFPAKTKNPLKMALNVRRLRELIRRERVDLVHARSRAPAWVALAAARKENVPFVTTYHGAYSGAGALKGTLQKCAYLGSHQELTVATELGEVFVVDADGTRTLRLQRTAPTPTRVQSVRLVREP